ncbi:MAG TPA: phage terminase large subunit, partial [Burkholderiales bacterium]|nr:phage terminase large subunit [Burkholderiales bacterium]
QPIENEGLLFPLSELKTFNIKDINEENIEHTSIFIDPADTGGDFYAALQAVIIGNKVFIVDVIFNNYGTDINIPASVELAFNCKANYVQIEGNSGWVLAGKNVRELIRDRLENCIVRIVKQSTNKETRIFTQSAWIKYNIYFREDYNINREYMAFINNVTSYLREGGNNHDDGADALVMLAEYCIRNLRHLWQA